MDFNEKQGLINKMQSTANDLSDLGLKLQRQGCQEESDQVYGKLRDLQDEIENLISQQMSDWQSGSAALVGQINDATGQVTVAIDEVKAAQQKATQVVKLVGLVDDVIGLAKTFV